MVAQPRAFRGLPFSGASQREIAQVVNGTLGGKLNCTGTVTLTANVATTTVSDPRVGNDSCIGFMATTANAATEFGAGTMYVSTRTAGTSFVITHVNAATADRSFVYSIIG